MDSQIIWNDQDSEEQTEDFQQKEHITINQFNNEEYKMTLFFFLIDIY